MDGESNRGTVDSLFFGGVGWGGVEVLLWLFITVPSQPWLLPALSGSPPSILLSSPCSDPSKTHSCLQPVTKINSGLDLSKFALFWKLFPCENTAEDKVLWPSFATHLFSQYYHHQAGAYCGSHHHIAGFHSDSVSSSINHLKPVEKESNVLPTLTKGRFILCPCASLIYTFLLVPKDHSNYPSSRSCLILDHKQTLCLNSCHLTHQPTTAAS